VGKHRRPGLLVRYATVLLITGGLLIAGAVGVLSWLVVGRR
jgi:hypothetical protein